MRPGPRLLELASGLVGQHRDPPAVAQLGDRLLRQLDRGLRLVEPSRARIGRGSAAPAARRSGTVATSSAKKCSANASSRSASTRLPSASSTQPSAAAALAPSQLRLVPLPPISSLAFSACTRAKRSRPCSAATSASVDRANA